MALVVETGLGLLGADSYASVERTDAFWAARGGNVKWAGAQPEQKEAALRNATDWLDINYLSGSEPYVAGQGLAYPFDDGYTARSMAAVERATMLLAPLAVDGPLMLTAPAEQAVLSRTEKVGDISESTTYSNPNQPLTLNGVDVSWLDLLLAQVSSRGGIVIGRRVT